jgi:tripeptidyl-peptidase-1
MHLFSAAALGTFLFAGTVISDSKNIVEKLNAPPPGWIKDDALTGLVDKDGLTMRLRFHMVQQKMDKFHDLAMKA